MESRLPESFLGLLLEREGLRLIDEAAHAMSM
jgi:hypothetical protein